MHTFIEILATLKTYYSTTMDSINTALQALALQDKPNVSATAKYTMLIDLRSLSVSVELLNYARLRTRINAYCHYSKRSHSLSILTSL